MSRRYLRVFMTRPRHAHLQRVLVLVLVLALALVLGCPSLLHKLTSDRPIQVAFALTSSSSTSSPWPQNANRFAASTTGP
jgi:hypothetical protein